MGSNVELEAAHFQIPLAKSFDMSLERNGLRRIGLGVQGVLDCVRGAYPDQTEEQVGDTLYASWSESAKRETLLEWAIVLCPPS